MVLRAAPEPFSDPIASERWFFVFTRFLHANRNPLRLKTLWAERRVRVKFSRNAAGR
jgi:hypothetical protein